MNAGNNSVYIKHAKTRNERILVRIETVNLRHVEFNRCIYPNGSSVRLESVSRDEFLKWKITQTICPKSSSFARRKLQFYI